MPIMLLRVKFHLKTCQTVKKGGFTVKLWKLKYDETVFSRDQLKLLLRLGSKEILFFEILERSA